jgi:hypothetical protein
LCESLTMFQTHTTVTLSEHNAIVTMFVTVMRLKTRRRGPTGVTAAESVQMLSALLWGKCTEPASNSAAGVRRPGDLYHAIVQRCII